jgi:hypothetical protein
MVNTTTFQDLSEEDNYHSSRRRIHFSLHRQNVIGIKARTFSI